MTAATCPLARRFRPVPSSSSASPARAAAAALLHARGEQVIATDGAPAERLRATCAAGVEVHAGVDGVALLERVRAVVKSPGRAAEAPVIAAARERGIPVLGELELAWRCVPNQVIAVTGTNGKTTTIELLGHLHREAGVPVAVVGNVGTAYSSLALDREHHEHEPSWSASARPSSSRTRSPSRPRRR